MDTPDNRRLILPNANVVGQTIENISHHPIRRADVSVGTDYSADIDRTREVLERAARSVPGRLQDRDPQVALSELGASSVDWQVRIWVGADDFWPVKEAATRAVKLALDEAGIGIPFPQMDVHLDQPTAG
jgi:small conductance mechanosensitive channel